MLSGAIGPSETVLLGRPWFLPQSQVSVLIRVLRYQESDASDVGEEEASSSEDDDEEAPEGN